MEGCSAEKDKKADKKIGKIRKVEGTAARSVEGSARCTSMSAPINGSDLILSDLLIFLSTLSVSAAPPLRSCLGGAYRHRSFS